MIPRIFPLFLLFAIGCASANRLSIKPEESHYHFVVNHHEGKHKAFESVELALARMVHDYPSIRKLRQPDTGTLLLRPVISYQVGGPLGETDYANYSLEVVVTDSTVDLTFDLGMAESSGLSVYPPENQIPKIRAEFTSIASSVASSVNGSLQ